MSRTVVVLIVLLSIVALKNGEVPEISDAALTKLRQLTIVTLSHRMKSISYDVIMRETGLHDIRKMEDLIIDCIYSDIVSGILKQQERIFEVSNAISRDVQSSDVDAMLKKIDKWFEMPIYIYFV